MDNGIGKFLPIDIFDEAEGYTSGAIVRTTDGVIKQVYKALSNQKNIFLEAEYLLNNIEGFTGGILNYGLDLFDKVFSLEELSGYEEICLYFLIANGFYNENQLKFLSNIYSINQIEKKYKDIDLSIFGSMIKQYYGENIATIITYE